MATALISPYAGGDEISLGDASALLAETGYPIAQRTLERQSRARGVRVVKYGGVNHASWTALLKVHAAWVDARGDGA
jgi:hypothetical protein